MWNNAFFNVHINLHQIYLLRKTQVFIWWGAVWAYLEAYEKALFFSSTARDSKRAGSANDYSQHRPCGCLQNKDRRLTTEDPKLKTQLSDISWRPYPFRVSRSSVLGLRSSLWDTPDQVEAREGGFLRNLLPSLNSQATSFRKLLQDDQSYFLSGIISLLGAFTRIFSDQNDKVKQSLRQLAFAVAAPIPLFTLFCSYFYCL